MLQLYKDLATYSLAATDDVFGGVADVYFDDRTWRLRYLVAKTGTWLSGKDTLVSVDLLGEPDVSAREWALNLTKAEVENADDAATVPPVSAHRENAIGKNWAPFMVFPADMAHPSLIAPEDMARLNRDEDNPPVNPNLRSMSEVEGYGIDADGDEIGSVADFVIDPSDWSVTHLAIDIGTWLPGKLVVVDTDQIINVAWRDRLISMSIDKEKIKASPPLDDLTDVDRADRQPTYLNHGFMPV